MAKVNAAPSASTFPSMPSGVSPSRKHSTTPARITATPATSSFEGAFAHHGLEEDHHHRHGVLQHDGVGGGGVLVGDDEQHRGGHDAERAQPVAKGIGGAKVPARQTEENGGDEGARAGDGQRVPGDEAGEQAAEAPAHAGEQYQTGGQAFRLHTKDPFLAPANGQSSPSRLAAAGGREAQYASLRRRMPFLRSTSSARAQSLT